MKLTALVALGTVATVFSSHPAYAQARPDLSSVVRMACATSDPTKERDLTMEGLTEALLVQSGYPVSNLVALGRTKAGPDYRDAIVAIALELGKETKGIGANVAQNALQLSQALMDGTQVSAKELGLTIVTGPPRPRSLGDRFWLWRQPASTSFRCLAGEPQKGVIEIVNAPSDIPFIGVTKAVEDLSKSDKRGTIDSAVVGVKVTRTTEDDGSVKKTTTLTFDGTVGVRLHDLPLPAFAYANYTLSRARTRPAPVLDAGKRADDGDTNGLALGVSIADIALPLDFSLTVGASYVFDFVKDSRRAVGTLNLAPSFGLLDVGLCRFGALKTLNIGGAKIRTRCILAGELDYSHVFKAGRADFEDRGDFLAIGPVIGIDVLAPLGESAGIVGNARYRFLPTVTGRAPDVRRLDLSLKYRWFLGSGFGLDFGGTYKHGEELKTYTREDEFLITFGIVH